MTAPRRKDGPIELERYLDAIRRHRRLVLTAAVAASIITVVLFLLQPRQYRATAAVVVPVPAEPGSRIAAVGQSVSDFEGALRSTVVAQEVSEATGESSANITSGLQTEQLFSGAIVEVTYSTSDPEVAEDVAELASREALVVLLTANLAPAEEQRAAAEDTSERLAAQYLNFLEQPGMLNPDQFFDTQQKRLIKIQDRIGRAEAIGDLERADELRAQLADKQALLTPLRVRWTSLQEARARANAILTEAEGTYEAADAVLDAAEEGRSVDVSQATAVPRAAQLLRQLLVVVVLSTALAIGLIVLLELVSVPRRPAPRVVTAVGEPMDRHDDGVAPVVGGSNAKKRSARSRKRRKAPSRTAKLG